MLDTEPSAIPSDKPLFQICTGSSVLEGILRLRIASENLDIAPSNRPFPERLAGGANIYCSPVVTLTGAASQASVIIFYVNCYANLSIVIINSQGCLQCSSTEFTCLQIHNVIIQRFE